MSNDLYQKIELQGQLKHNLTNLLSSLLTSNTLLIKKIDSNSLNSSFMSNNSINLIQINQTVILVYILIIMTFFFGCLAFVGIFLLGNKLKINIRKVILNIYK